MKPFKRVSFAILGACLVIAPTTANARTIQAVAGKPIQIGRNVSFAKECSQGPVPWITIIDKPVNGTISTDLGPVKMEHALVGSTNCDGHSAKGLLIFYTANPGFHGKDHLQYKVDYFPRGNSYQSIDINVK